MMASLFALLLLCAQTRQVAPLAQTYGVAPQHRSQYAAIEQQKSAITCDGGDEYPAEYVNDNVSLSALPRSIAIF